MSWLSKWRSTTGTHERAFYEYGENERKRLSGIVGEEKKKNKYNAIPKVIDGYRFDSTAESDYYRVLKQKVKFNEINFFIRQAPFHLPGNTRLVSDFVVFNTDGSFQVFDVKGEKPTALWSTKKKMVEALYPIKIEIITKREVNELKKRYLLE